jgi:hypothetical protein
MLNLIFVILVFALIAGYEGPSLVVNKQWRELVAFSVILLFGLVIGCLMVMGVELPNPVNGIIFVIIKIYNLLVHVF